MKDTNVILICIDGGRVDRAKKSKTFQTLLVIILLYLKKVCNEIIVVDSLSSDNTINVAKSLGAKIYLQEFLGDGPQKKLAASYSKNDWVLSLDADERLEEDLINHINSIDLTLQDCEAYSFRRRNFCGKKWIKAASFYPDRVTRL